jgi:hypothetical protein
MQPEVVDEGHVRLSWRRSVDGEPEIRERDFTFPQVSDLQTAVEDGLGKPDVTVEYSGPRLQEPESPCEG